MFPGPKKSNNSVTLEGPFGWCAVCSSQTPGAHGYCAKQEYNMGIDSSDHDDQVQTNSFVNLFFGKGGLVRCALTLI